VGLKDVGAHKDREVALIQTFKLLVRGPSEEAESFDFSYERDSTKKTFRALADHCISQIL
jgi:hypothetical protein